MIIKRESVGYFSSFLIHAALFLCFSAVMVRSARYGVKAGLANMEVDLVAPTKQEEPLLPDEILREPEAPQAEKVLIPEPVKPKAPEKPVAPKIASPVQSSSQGAVSTNAPSGSTVAANPNYLLNPAPPYPELARSMKQEGLVMLLVDVDRAGKPTKVEIEKSSGHTLLDQAALKAVSRWKFQPARIGSLAIDSKAEVPIRFRLDG